MAPKVFLAGPVSENLIIDVERLPEPMTGMITARSSRTRLGGTSAGKALNLRALGVDVTLRTVVGPDPEADRVLAALVAAGTTVLAEVDPDGATERHVNLMAIDGRRLSIYLSAPPVTGPPTPEALAALSAADAVIIDLSDHARPLLREAVAQGRDIWCDIHDYDGANPFQEEFIGAATQLFVSADRLPDVRGFMASRVAAGAKLVVCMQGASGALAATPDGRWYDVPAVAVPAVVDTNGAGDAFFAGFLRTHLAGGSIEAALAAGTQEGARCVQSSDLV